VVPYGADSSLTNYDLAANKGVAAMNRFAFLVLASFVTLFSLSGCAADTDSGEPALTDEQLRGGCRYDCPRCHPGQVCPRYLCRLICPPGVSLCGATLCRNGDVCCNASCGICTPPGGLCTQQVCGTEPPPPPPPAGACTTDADCRAVSNYCDGCACNALSTTDPDPVCSGTIVNCFVDPCFNHTAVCNTTTHTCELQ
jgi:hypothetical protein